MGTYADTSAIVDGTTINASDVKTPLDALDTALYNYVTGAAAFTTVLTGSGAGVKMNGAANSLRFIRFTTSSVARWDIGAGANSESGDAGADVFFSRYNDAGTFQGIALSVYRSNGKVQTEAELQIGGALNHDGSTVGFYGTTPATKQTVTGSRGANAALASLLTALAAIGLLTDSSS